MVGQIDTSHIDVGRVPAKGNLNENYCPPKTGSDYHI